MAARKRLIPNVSRQRGRSPKGFRGRGVGGIRPSVRRRPGGSRRGPIRSVFKRR